MLANDNKDDRQTNFTYFNDMLAHKCLLIYNLKNTKIIFLLNVFNLRFQKTLFRNNAISHLLV